MRMTTNQAIRRAADLINRLSTMDRDSFIDIDDNLWFKTVHQNPIIFDVVETDTYNGFNEGDLIYFDYVDLERVYSSRVGYVMDPDAYSLHGSAILLYDLDVAEPRKFICSQMSNIYWLVPSH